MGFFAKFPKIEYDRRTAVSILTSVLPSRMNIDNSFIWQRHRIAEESPESLAYDLYRDANLYWVILVTNNIIDPFTDWPVPEDAFEEFVNKKYNNKPNEVHHYFDNRTDDIVDDFNEAKFRQMPNADLPYYIIPVTNYTHEKNLNDAKRDILVVNPKYINEFLETYEKALQGTL